MLVMRPRATWLFGGVLLASACTAEAQEFSANGFLDGGLVIPSHDKSWLKGGFGKLDNGGGGGQSPALVSQGVADLRLTLDPSAFVFATMRASPDQHAPFDVLEAYGRYQPIATADRLWSIGLFGEARQPDAVALSLGKTPPLREEPWKEVDSRPGYYLGASARQDGLGRLTVLRYDNRADPARHIGSDFGWRTKFTSLGLETYLGDIVILSQAMFGNTDIQPFDGFHSTTDFQSAYLLAGYYFGEFRVAGRVDVFA